MKNGNVRRSFNLLVKIPFSSGGFALASSHIKKGELDEAFTILLDIA